MSYILRAADELFIGYNGVYGGFEESLRIRSQLL
jgi:hypothetical protein